MHPDQMEPRVQKMENNIFEQKEETEVTNTDLLHAINNVSNSISIMVGMFERFIEAHNILTTSIEELKEKSQ